MIEGNEIILPKVELNERDPRVRINGAISSITKELKEALIYVEQNKENLPSILTIDDLYYVLSDFFENRDSLASSFLGSLFKNKDLFHSVYYTDVHLKNYAKCIASYLLSHAREDDSYISESASLVWLFSSPNTILASLAVISSDFNHKVSQSCVDQLQTLTSVVYQVDTKTLNKDLSDLYLLKPLIRKIELHERTKVLLFVIEELRALLGEDAGFDFITFSEDLQQISNFSYLSEIREAFDYGVNKSRAFMIAESEFRDHSGNNIVQDQIFLSFVSEQSKEIVNILYDLKQKIKVSDSHSEISEAISMAQREVVYNVTSIVLLGRNEYSLESICSLLKKEYETFLANVSSDELFCDLLKLMLPFILTNAEEAFKFKVGLERENIIKRVFECLKSKEALKVEQSIQCLLEIYPPLRFYKITELVGRNSLLRQISEDFGSNIELSADYSAIIDYWLLKKEQEYIDKILALLLQQPN